MRTQISWTLVTYLNEYPTAILGGFDPAYLELPDEILITVMRGHQKYFALERKDGSLAPHFLAVINLDKDRAGLIRAGHERVLARAICGRAVLLGDGSEMSARRLSSKTERGDLPGEARKLRRQGRARAHAGPLARRAMVCQRHPAGERGCGGPRCRACQVRSGHGHGSRVYRACRELSAGSMQNLKENLKKSPGPSTINTSLPASTIPSRGT